MMVITDLTEGTSLYNPALKTVHKPMMITNPAKTPRLNFKLPLNPYLDALDMDIMLLGPGVNVVMKTYDKKALKFGKMTLSLLSVCFLSLEDIRCMPHYYYNSKDSRIKD